MRHALAALLFAAPICAFAGSGPGSDGPGIPIMARPARLAWLSRRRSTCFSQCFPGYLTGTRSRLSPSEYRRPGL